MRTNITIAPVLMRLLLPLPQWLLGLLALVQTGRCSVNVLSSEQADHVEDGDDEHGSQSDDDDPSSRVLGPCD